MSNPVDPIEQNHAQLPALHALQLLAQGEAQQALKVCIDALSGGYRSAELSNVAGVCAAAFGEQALAVQLWQHALELSPGFAQAWFNLGLMHDKAGEPQQAEQEYRKAIQFDAANVDAMVMLASLLIKQERRDEAEPFLRQALALDNNHAQANNNLGLLLFKKRDFEQAERHYLQALKVSPQEVSVLVNLGVLYAAMERVFEAEEYYLQALELDPHNAEALTNYGLTLEILQRPQEAEQRHLQALALKPASPEILDNLGNLLNAQRREAEGERYLLQALAIDPDSAAAHTNYGVMLTNMKRDAEAEQHFNRAMALKPDYMLPRLNLGFMQLALGRFAEGWKNYEARFDPRLPDNGIPLPPVSAPQWRGEDLNGKSLLVWGEQGFGDQIQCSRYIPLIKQRWDVRITLVCRGGLKRLFQTLQGVDELHAHSPELVLPDRYDYWIMPFSIPLCMGDVQNIPARVPYLYAIPEDVKRWQSRLGTHPFKVGLLWRGNQRHHNDDWRSLPGPARFSSLLEIPGIDFISLQKEKDATLSNAFFKQTQVINLGESLEDFADTAAVVAQLDLVVTVDTSVAHLAGAMGKPCWVMLPYYRTDWRWQRERTDTPWYPTMRLFRQGKDEDWEPVIESIKHELIALKAKI